MGPSAVRTHRLQRSGGKLLTLEDMSKRLNPWGQRKVWEAHQRQQQNTKCHVVHVIPPYMELARQVSKREEQHSLESQKFVYIYYYF